jgi:hypothetical protein
VIASKPAAIRKTTGDARRARAEVVEAQRRQHADRPEEQRGQGGQPHAGEHARVADGAREAAAHGLGLDARHERHEPGEHQRDDRDRREDQLGARDLGRRTPAPARRSRRRSPCPGRCR